MSSSPLASIAILASGLLAATSLPVHAQSHGGDVIVQVPQAFAGHEIKHRTVKYADLDLNNSADAETLVRRIRNAAKVVCSPAPSHAGELKNGANYSNCLKGAATHAVAAVGNPLVQQTFDRLG